MPEQECAYQHSPSRPYFRVADVPAWPTGSNLYARSSHFDPGPRWAGWLLGYVSRKTRPSEGQGLSKRADGGGLTGAITKQSAKHLGVISLKSHAPILRDACKACWLVVSAFWAASLKQLALMLVFAFNAPSYITVEYSIARPQTHDIH